jgi:hypothetical protein
MVHRSWFIDHDSWVIGDGAACGMLEVGSGRLDEVAEVAGSIHINLPVLFLFSCFLFHFHFHISYFKNISGMNSVGSIRKMFDRTAWFIKRLMD